MNFTSPEYQGSRLYSRTNKLSPITRLPIGIQSAFGESDGHRWVDAGCAPGAGELPRAVAGRVERDVASVVPVEVNSLDSGRR